MRCLTANAAANESTMALPSPLRSRRRWQRPFTGVALALLVATLTTVHIYHRTWCSLGPAPIDIADDMSVTVSDRNDKLLRPFTAKDGRWRLPVRVDDVDPTYLAMLLAFEDRRFYEHGGVDPYSVLRAAGQAIRHGRLVSGASTLTMQVARLLERKHERTASGKWRQMVRARQLEQRLSKREILNLYLRLAPFGGNLEGIRAATLGYFGKEPKRLSLGEAALLVALPQSPENRRLDRHPHAAQIARNRVLKRAIAAGVIAATDAAHAMRTPVKRRRFAFPKLAPHLTETEVAARPEKFEHHLTLDKRLQSSLEILAREQARLQGQNLSTAIIVADHGSGEILAEVGASDYFDASRLGAVDMVNAVRSPGSLLKPFIFGLSFEAGYAHPETLIDDRPMRFGDYAPKNFDDDYQGTLSVRAALTQSRNVPAVKALERVGPGKLASRFRRAGVDAKFPPGSTPTLAMALGGTGLTLRDLTQLYATLARGGQAITLRHVQGADALPDVKTGALGLQRSRRLMSATAAWYVSDILKDSPPPTNAPAGRFAYKTGTSYGYRDAWAIGYDGRHVVAVWIGRPDGASVPGMMGRNAAAPILFDAFKRIAPNRVPLPPPPRGALVASASDLPVPLKRWREPGDDGSPKAFLSPPILIAFPPHTAELAADDFAADPMVLKAEGGAQPLTWLVNGKPIASDPHASNALWQPSGPGFATLTVIDANGKTDRAAIRIK